VSSEITDVGDGADVAVIEDVIDEGCMAAMNVNGWKYVAPSTDSEWGWWG